MRKIAMESWNETNAKANDKESYLLQGISSGVSLSPSQAGYQPVASFFVGDEEDVLVGQKSRRAAMTERSKLRAARNEVRTVKECIFNEYGEREGKMTLQFEFRTFINYIATKSRCSLGVNVGPVGGTGVISMTNNLYGADLVANVRTEKLISLGS
jgi:hypothetical protein